MLYACVQCGKVSDKRYCEQHRSSKTKTGRPTPRDRGYSKHYERNRRELLASKPACTYCNQPATIAHHKPARRVLVAMRVEDPDDPAFLIPICRACHNRETAQGK